SANAVRYLPRDVGQGRSAAAVGAGTAAALREVGFSIEAEGRSGVGALASALAASRPSARVLWLRGERAREDGAAALAAAGWAVEEVVTYRTRAVPGFARAVGEIGTVDAWVFGSP